MRACPSNINPNCVSTASTNDTYGSAWRASDTDPLKAAEVLEVTVGQVFGPTSSRLLSVKSLEGVGQYRMFGVDNPFGGEDTLEWVTAATAGAAAAAAAAAVAVAARQEQSTRVQLRVVHSHVFNARQISARDWVWHDLNPLPGPLDKTPWLSTAGLPPHLLPDFSSSHKASQTEGGQVTLKERWLRTAAWQVGSWPLGVWCKACLEMPEDTSRTAGTHTMGSVRYLWPIQQPLTDFDAQRKRLAVLRKALGWSVIG
ncbi:hypothetical protein QJQ45_016230, partial [Haematococcus lacustris]